MSLVLASASPRRKELLDAAGIACDVRPVDVDETRLPDEPADEYVRRVAALKADRAAALWPDDTVLAADTAVRVGTDVLGKPRSAADAVAMLEALAGRAHEVLTGVAIRWPGGGARDFVERTAVTFRPLSPEDIAWYVATREPMDKAGAYAIQGLGSRFATRIEGSYANVVGLPVASVADVLEGLGATSLVTGA